MGNQGTKDWKLTAFFAISLMLIAGLFSDAALAGDGDGNVTVEGWWGMIVLSPTLPLFLLLIPRMG